MALINCPECGKEISDKSKQCIHCGYPLEALENTSNIDNKNNLYSVNFIDIGTQKVKVIKVTREITGLGLKEAKDLVDHVSCIKTNVSLEEANSIKKQMEEIDAGVEIVPCSDNNKVCTPVYKSTLSRNVPKCPTCGSTNIRKISATSKAVSAGLFGIFSSKIRKQFHCNSCKYEW